MVMAMWRIEVFQDDGAWRLESSIQIKGVLDEFNLGRAGIREDNGHYIEAGSGFCQVVFCQVLQGYHADLDLFFCGDGLTGVAEQGILSGLDLNKNQGLGLLRKRERDNINFPVMIPVVSFNDSIPGIQKVRDGQLFTPLAKNISPAVRQIP
jgi:hypothetical protein